MPTTAGLRTPETVSGTTTAFTWDIRSPLPLLLADGATSYVYDPGGVPLEQVTASGTLYYHQDQLGSTRALTNASGAVVSTYSFNPYGNLTGSTGTVTNPFRYAGQYTDTETGFQYLRARSYDPATTQFLTRDPLAAITWDAYGYAGRKPLNAIDPSGLSWFSWLTTPTNLPNPGLVTGTFDVELGGAEMAIGTAEILGGTGADASLTGAVVGVPAQISGAVELPRFRGHFALFGNRSSRCRRHARLTILSSGNRWWSWCGPAVPRVSLNARRPVRASGSLVNRTALASELLVSKRATGRLSTLPRVVSAGGDTQQIARPAHRILRLVGAHESEDLDGTDPVSRASQAAAFAKISRSSRSRRFSRRSRCRSSCSAPASEVSGPLPSTLPLWSTQLRIDCADG
jgi:RHS repeat-associated protein